MLPQQSINIIHKDVVQLRGLKFDSRRYTPRSILPHSIKQLKQKFDHKSSSIINSETVALTLAK